MPQTHDPQPGTPVAQLDTPCLILDMDALDHNMDVIADFYETATANYVGIARTTRVRPSPCARSSAAAPSAACAPPRSPRLR